MDGPTGDGQANEPRGTEFSGQALLHPVGTEPTRERRVTEGQANLKDREGVAGLWPDDCP